MIAICSRCGCCWDTTEESAFEPNVLCGPCYWNLQPGDRVVCIDASDPAWFLRESGLYTVEAVQRDGQRAMVFLYGFTKGWPWQQFRFVGRPLKE